jgi:hypothetical protein
VTGEYGQKAVGFPGTPLVITANQKIEPLLFKLVPAANLMGTVSRLWMANRSPAHW